MTRTAPLLTLLAVGVLGGALFTASAMGAAQAETVTAGNAFAAAPAAPAPTPGGELQLSDIPVAGGDDGQGGEGEPRRVEVDVADLPVAGAAGQPPAEAPAAPEAAAPEAAAPEAAAPEAAEAAPPAVEAPEVGVLADATYAGKTADGAMTVAVAVKDDRVVAYVCDGGAVEIWLSGSAMDGRVVLESKTGRSTMIGTLVDGTITGTVSIDGDVIEYSAEQISVAKAAKNGRADVGEVAERAGLAS